MSWGFLIVMEVFWTGLMVQKSCTRGTCHMHNLKYIMVSFDFIFIFYYKYMSFLLSSLLNVGHLKKWLIQNENCLHVLTLISLHTYDFLLRKKEYWQSFHSIQWKDFQKWQKAPYNYQKSSPPVHYIPSLLNIALYFCVSDWPKRFFRWTILLMFF